MWVVAALALAGAGCGDDETEGTASAGGSAGSTTAATTTATGATSATGSGGSGATSTPTSTTSATGGTAGTGMGTAGDTGTGSTGEVAVCGDGVTEGVEMCDADPDCREDCTYPAGMVFWTVFENGITPSDPATVWGVDFDPGGDVVAGGMRFGVGATGFVTKYDADGQQVWSDQYSTAEFDNPVVFGVGVDPAGTVVGVLQDNFSTQGGNDIIYAQWTPDGQRGWSRRIQRPATDVSTTVRFEPGTAAVVSAGLTNQAAVNVSRGLLITLTPQGTVDNIIEHFGEDNTPDRFYDVALDATGNRYVLGCCDELGQAFVRKYDPAGAVLWTTVQPSWDIGAFMRGGIAIGPGNDVYAVAPNDDRTSTMARVTPTGALIYARVIAEGQEMVANALGATPQGGLVVVGDRFFNVSGEANVWYARLDDQAATVWADEMDGSNFPASADRANDVAIDAHGLAAVVGWLIDSGGNAQQPVGFVRKFAP